MGILITFNRKALAYFDENHDPAFYEDLVNKTLGGLANGFSWNDRQAKARVEMGILDELNGEYRIRLTLNDPASLLVKHWAGLRRVDMYTYIRQALTNRMDTRSPKWLMGARISVSSQEESDRIAVGEEMPKPAYQPG